MIQETGNNLPRGKCPAEAQASAQVITSRKCVTSVINLVLSVKPHTRSSVDTDTKSPNSLFLANKGETYSKLLSRHHRPICFLHLYVIFNIILSVY